MEERQRYRDLFEARETLSAAEMRFERVRRTLGLWLGPAAFLALLLFPPGLAAPAARLLAVLSWVLVWWITEAVPIPVTALLGPALAVISGVGTAKELFAPFGDPIIFLFLGSFIIAAAMESSKLDRRFAYAILARPWVGSSTSRLLVAFALITALLSMWLSNTATTAMMYPIALSVLTAFSRLLSRDGQTVDCTRLRYGTALMLATAYSASIGGIATPVGTPPNLIILGQLSTLAGVRLSFFQWMVLASPLMLLMLAILLLYLRQALPAELKQIEGSAELVRAERAELGSWSIAQRNVLLAFGVTVFLWIFPGVVSIIAGNEAPLSRALQRLLPEGVVALLGAVLLFVLPVHWSQRRFTMGWNEAARIDWGTLLLFGGGLSLGEAMFHTGLAAAVGRAMVRVAGTGSPAVLCYLFAAIAIVITETTSNTATATMVGPLAIAAARAAGHSPVPPAVSCALASSMAFLLPVSTPPNAIVYGSGCVPITAMLRHGAVLDLASLALVPGLVLLLSRWLGIA